MCAPGGPKTTLCRRQGQDLSHCLIFFIRMVDIPRISGCSRFCPDYFPFASLVAAGERVNFRHTGEKEENRSHPAKVFFHLLDICQPDNNIRALLLIILSVHFLFTFIFSGDRLSSMIESSKLKSEYMTENRVFICFISSMSYVVCTIGHLICLVLVVYVYKKKWFHYEWLQ